MPIERPNQLEEDIADCEDWMRYYNEQIAWCKSNLLAYEELLKENEVRLANLLLRKAFPSQK